MKCDYSKYYNYTILQIIFKVMGGLTVTSRLAPNNGAQSDSTSSVSWEEDRQVPPPRTECSICTCCFQLQSLGTEREHVRSCYRGATSVQSCRQALFHSQGLDINYIINTIKNRHFFFAYDEAVFPRGWTPCCSLLGFSLNLKYLGLQYTEKRVFCN